MHREQVVEAERHVGRATGCLLDLAPVRDLHALRLICSDDEVGGRHDIGSLKQVLYGRREVRHPALRHRPAKARLENAGAHLGRDLDRRGPNPLREEEDVKQTEREHHSTKYPGAFVHEKSGGSDGHVAFFGRNRPEVDRVKALAVFQKFRVAVHLHGIDIPFPFCNRRHFAKAHLKEIRNNFT